MESMLKNKKTILFFVLPGFLIYALFVFVPIIRTIYYSFFDWNLIGTKVFKGFGNYKYLFQEDDVFVTSLKNTFILLVMSLFVQVPCGILFAVALAGKVKGKSFFKTVYFLPNMISSVAIGLMWSNLLDVNVGVFHNFFKAFGFEKAANTVWLGDPKTVMWCVVLIASWQYIGYHMVLYYSGIQGIPDTLFEAARVDGASGWRLLWHIILPLLKPIIKIDAVFIATGSLRSFDLVFTMTTGGPNHASELLATHMYNKAFIASQYGYGSSIAIIMVLLSIVITLFLNKLLKSENLEF